MPPPIRFIYNTLRDPDLVLRIREALIASERDEMLAMQNNLIEKNNALGGTPGAFLYAGNFISNHSRSVYQKRTILPLNASLDQEGVVFWEAYQNCHRLWKEIHQKLSIILPQVRTLQELRDMFPDLIASKVWPKLKRQTPENEALDVYPHLKKHMERLVEIGFLSQAKRLLD